MIKSSWALLTFIDDIQCLPIILFSDDEARESLSISGLTFWTGTANWARTFYQEHKFSPSSVTQWNHLHIGHPSGDCILLICPKHLSPEAYIFYTSVAENGTCHCCLNLKRDPCHQMQWCQSGPRNAETHVHASFWLSVAHCGARYTTLYSSLRGSTYI